ncbi:hypothetical protein ASE04_18600 [Rhizobium sp. Root708]|nr:hypothetical protein ASE04_18600 [Rhizobium sp. Root708]
MSSAIHDANRRQRQTCNDSDLRHAAQRAASSWHQLEAGFPKVAAEIRGIAEGSGLAPLDVYLLSGFDFFEGAPSSGCTTAACTIGDGAIVAQNWDAPPGTDRNLVLMIHEAGDDSLMMVTSPGTLGWVGMNRTGLALVTNDLMLDVQGHGLPTLAVRRILLSHGRACDAMNAVRQLDHRAGRCYLLGDAHGDIAGVEISPMIGAWPLSGHSIVHTNHPIVPATALMEDIEAVAHVYPSSRERLRAARAHTVACGEDMRRLLADTNGSPDAICKTASRREPTQTAFSIIFDCAKRQASVCLGRPDRSRYHAFTLDVATAV